MAVLLQYNARDTLPEEELVATTCISKDILSQVLTLLVKAKVLINEEIEQYDLSPSHIFLVSHFTSLTIVRLQIRSRLR
jgi:cullin 1